MRPDGRLATELWRRRGARSATIPDGAYAATEQALAECHTVWHFACHCQVQPDCVLDSTLQLEGGELSLRAVLAMSPAPRRLAVLSACETHRSGSDLPDEAMGLPAGLLHAGFAGVIASHWPAQDYSTAYLMTRFHDLWLNHGLRPAAALAQAQRWLRTATPADLSAYDRVILRGGSMPPVNSGSEPHGEREHQVFRHPFYWALFALTGH